jgi:hypothetical protein
MRASCGNMAVSLAAPLGHVLGQSQCSAHGAVGLLPPGPLRPSRDDQGRPAVLRRRAICTQSECARHNGDDSAEFSLPRIRGHLERNAGVTFFGTCPKLGGQNHDEFVPKQGRRLKDWVFYWYSRAELQRDVVIRHRKSSGGARQLMPSARHVRIVEPDIWISVSTQA